MSFNSYSNTAISTISTDTFATNAQLYTMLFRGLRPNTKHTLYLEGENYSWGVCQFGKNLGEDLISNLDGGIALKVLYEIPSSRPAEYEMKETKSIAFYSERINRENGRMEDVVNVDHKTWEIVSDDGDSRATFEMHLHIVMINNDYNSLFQYS